MKGFHCRDVHCTCMYVCLGSAAWGFWRANTKPILSEQNCRHLINIHCISSDGYRNVINIDCISISLWRQQDQYVVLTNLRDEVQIFQWRMHYLLWIPKLNLMQPKAGSYRSTQTSLLLYTPNWLATFWPRKIKSTIVTPLPHPKMPVCQGATACVVSLATGLLKVAPEAWCFYF